MDKHPSLPPDLGRESLGKLERDFHLQYGVTLAAWARVEQMLSRLFCILCQLDPNERLGRELFFSGRSFQTRADLLWAALRTAELPDDLRSIITKVLKRARDYSGARNKIAHGYPSHAIFPDVSWQGWRIKEGEQSHLPGGIGLVELANAYGNFREMERAIERIGMVVRSHFAGRSPPPEEFLAQAQELPRDAFLPEQRQSGEECPSRGEQ